MLGVKINEFDNSDGTIKSFNKIFPRTPLMENPCREVTGLENYVEILGIAEKKMLTAGACYVRMIEVNGVVIEHDFGEDNFRDGEMFNLDDNVRFKYFARNLEGEIIAKAFGCKELANELGCHVSVIKRRLIKNVELGSRTEHLFNVTRKEI